MAPLHLADNTNLFGTSPAILEAIRLSGADDATQYPPTSGPAVREAIAGYLGVRPNEIVLGTGGDGVIDCALRAFCEPGDAVAHPDPTFVMARYFATSNRPDRYQLRCAPTHHRCRGAVRRGAAASTCARRTSDGVQPTEAELRFVLERARGFVMIDEAYAEFAGATLTSEMAQHPRAIIVRTFSKALGLAGMRVGYAVGDESLVREIEKARGPFAVSNVALRAATAVLSHGSAWVQQCIAASLAARAELTALLAIVVSHRYRRRRTSVSFQPLCQETVRGLSSRGISVRPFRHCPYRRCVTFHQSVRPRLCPAWLIASRVVPPLSQCGVRPARPSPSHRRSLFEAQVPLEPMS